MLDASQLDVADKGMMYMTQQGFGGSNFGPQPGDEDLGVRFVMDIMEDQDASAKEGRPIYKEVPFVQIMTPGDREIFMVMADEEYISRFPKQWEAFQRMNDEDAVEGTPLSEWPGINRAQAEELKFYNCHTLEQLANVADSQLQEFQGFGTLRERARRYLAASRDQAEANEKQALEDRLKNLEDKLEQAGETIRDQNVIIEAMKAGGLQPQAQPQLQPQPVVQQATAAEILAPVVPEAAEWDVPAEPEPEPEAAASEEPAPPKRRRRAPI